MSQYSAKLLHLGPHTTIEPYVLEKLIGKPVKSKYGQNDGIIKKAWVEDEWVRITVEEVENEHRTVEGRAEASEELATPSD